MKKVINRSQLTVSIQGNGAVINVSSDEGKTKIGSQPSPLKLPPTGKVRRGENFTVKPGRELDSLVARFVLGWTLDKTVPPLSQKDNPVPYYKDGKGESRVLPLFSTSDASALSVFQALRSDGSFCCLSIDSDYDYYYDVTLTLCKLHSPYQDPSGHPADVVVSRNSLAEAICIAALEGIAAKKELERGSHGAKVDSGKTAGGDSSGCGVSHSKSHH